MPFDDNLHQQMQRQQQEWFQDQHRKGAEALRKQMDDNRRRGLAGGVEAGPIGRGAVIGIVAVLVFVAAVFAVIALSGGGDSKPKGTSQEFIDKARQECVAAGFSAEQCESIAR